jgi:hypothetical protein
VQAAKRTTAALKPGTETELDAQMLEDIAGDAPSMELGRNEALRSIPEVMVAVGLQPSKSAARRYLFREFLVPFRSSSMHCCTSEVYCDV